MSQGFVQFLFYSLWLDQMSYDAPYIHTNYEGYIFTQSQWFQLLLVKCLWITEKYCLNSCQHSAFMCLCLRWNVCAILLGRSCSCLPVINKRLKQPVVHENYSHTHFWNTHIDPHTLTVSLVKKQVYELMYLCNTKWEEWGKKKRRYLCFDESTSMHIINPGLCCALQTPLSTAETLFLDSFCLPFCRSAWLYRSFWSLKKVQKLIS